MMSCLSDFCAVNTRGTASAAVVVAMVETKRRREILGFIGSVQVPGSDCNQVPQVCNPAAALSSQGLSRIRRSMHLLSVKERGVYGAWMSFVLLLWLSIPGSLACSR